MKKLTIFVFIFFLFSFVLLNSSHARIKQYIHPYDISQLEWQLLNWTAAWRNTNTPVSPFTLERMEYDRTKQKVIIYLRGESGTAADENFSRSLDSISFLFKQKFPEFNITEDAVIYYDFTASQGAKTAPVKYENGSFIKRQDDLPESLPDIDTW